MKRSVLLAFLLLPFAAGAAAFAWRSLPLGGGGFLTGIVAHPACGDLIYARTDVGGIYRYEPARRGGHPGWRQLMQWIPADQAHLWGCDGIALNPQDADEVYALLGSYEYDPEPCGIYKSDDRGATWRHVYQTRCGGNENGRWIGEPIAVQPAGRGRVVVAGTRHDGVVRSSDGGATWQPCAGVVSDPAGWGVRCVVFDPSAPEVVYALDERRLWRSDDGGRTFAEWWMPGDVQLRQAVVTADGRCYITTSGGVYACDTATRPVRLPGLDAAWDLNAIAADPRDPYHLFLAGTLAGDGVHHHIFRSADGGASWADLTRDAEVRNHVAWYDRSHFAAALASLAVDPFHRGRVWFTDWYLPWRCDDVTAPIPCWQSVPWGVEELVVFDIVAPPGDALIYQGCADNGGFTHYSLTEYPTVGYDNQESTGLDFCEAYPECIVRVSSLGWGQSNFRLSVSDDAGRTWRAVGGDIAATGKVACSAADPANFIFAPTGPDRKVLFTTDRGATQMRESQGLPAPGLNHHFWDNWNRHVASDRVAPGRFYVAMPGGFYVSDDGGATFARRWTGVPDASGVPAFYLAASPYCPGDVWMSTGREGLLRTTDAGHTFRRVGPFSSTRCVAVGPPLRGATPVVYVYGRLGGVWGVYWSQDEGASWERINDDRMQFSDNPRQMAADRDRPGRVYLGTGGTGIWYGECPLPRRRGHD